MREKVLINENVGLCRSCINKKYGLSLQPKDCMYKPYKQKCLSCGQMHQMIFGLKVSGKAKIMFA